MLQLDPLLLTCPTVEATPDAARYFPLVSGRYEVKPGMVPFGTDFGNDECDRQVFQFDHNFAHYRQVKQAARAERLSKYYQTQNYSDEVAGAIAQFIIQRLIQEHPQHFQIEALTAGALALHNQLTGETLDFTATGQLQRVRGDAAILYVDALDALANQVQEDLAVISRCDRQHWVSAIHLCFPNHWSAAAKIGQDFATVHAPVAEMEKINQRGIALTHNMIVHPPTVRFAWGLSLDTRLNHHPEPPTGVTLNQWQGRQFDPQQPCLFVRVERQVIWGFPVVDAVLFAIRTTFWDCAALRQVPERRSQLISALRSMSPASLVYKGLAESKPAILAWLATG